MTVRIWDVATGKVECILEGHSDSVHSVAFSPHGSKLGSGSDDRTVRVWDVTTGQVEHVFEGHSDRVSSIAFSPDGNKLVSGSDDGTVRVWNVATGQAECTMEAHSSLVYSLGHSEEFLPDEGKPDLGQPETARNLVKCRSSYSVNKSKCWVTQDGSKILYLPPDHRPWCMDFRGSSIAIGTFTGRVTIITFYPDRLASVDSPAWVLDTQDRDEDEAVEKMRQQKLELLQKVLGSGHPVTLTSMNNLAEMLRHKGKYEAAEEMHRPVLGPEHPDTLASMNNLAVVLYSQGKYEAAEEMRRLVLELKQKVLGPEYPSMLNSMNNLAMVLYSQGKDEAAEEMHRRALDARAKRTVANTSSWN
jgi:Tetratricopeptide repeat/WD domain, G-beta repeat